MGRKKSKRELSFKPQFRDFAPIGRVQEQINLHHEELEAIYLMDYKGMYQEDAAKQMGVSRPTLSRIIKNARLKVATLLVNGKHLHIEDEKTYYKISMICDDPLEFGELGRDKKYLVVVSIDNDKIVQIEKTDNPLLGMRKKPAMVIPAVLSTKKVNYFLLDSIGEGFKNSLIANGIVPLTAASVTKESVADLIE